MKAKGPRSLLAALAGLCVCAIAGIISWTGTTLATPGSQFNSEILVRSFFEQIRVNTARNDRGGDRNQHSTFGQGQDDDDDQDENAFKVKIKAPQPSDVYIVRNRVPPGGHSGWHTHPGPSVVSVKSGTATVYSGDDPSCTPVMYPAGTGFVDEGGEHVHLVRNEGSVELEVIAFQIIPAGGDRRIDAPDPGFCPF